MRYLLVYTIWSMRFRESNRYASSWENHTHVENTAWWHYNYPNRNFGELLKL